MPTHSILAPKPYVLAIFIASSVLCCAAQTQSAAPSSSPKPKTPATATHAKTAAPAAPVLQTPKDKLSYAIGADMAGRLKSQSIDVDPIWLSRGLKDVFAGTKPLMTQDEVHAAILDLQNQLRQKQMALMKELGDKNKKEGDAFLAENKGKEGVVTLPSGLQYKILKAGDGEKPKATDTVVCNYRGTLISGEEFDSSYKRGQPVTFPVTGVIKGWTEALQLMPIGSKWQLFIPPDLAYGERGHGNEIAPESTLVFEVELISIQPKQ
ncbi:MAG: FKBP-type peptidyl-prolyl cis-trans isomerase [Terriglobales bacterium]